MKRFRKILLVYDGRDSAGEALERAFTLAKKNKARLTVVDVLEEMPRKTEGYIDRVPVNEFEKIAREEKASEISGLIKSTERRTRVKAEVKILTGKTHIEIIKEVLRNKHDLVMKTAEGKDGTKKMFFGGIDISLMRKCPCPVWIVKPSKADKYSRILAAVDPDPFNEKIDKMNDLIMDLALSLSKLDNSELHIVHVWSIFGENILRGPRFRKTEAEMKKLIQDEKDFRQDSLDKLISRRKMGKTDYKVHLLKGDPSELIPKVAKKEKIDLIVMGTLCRTGLPGIIIGNTAESVLSQVNCSVLTVKPEGFVSPVRLDD